MQYNMYKKQIIYKTNIMYNNKVSMGDSHQVNFLLEIFLDVDFKQKYTKIGSIRIEKVEDLQKLIIDLINSQ